MKIVRDKPKRLGFIARMTTTTIPRPSAELIARHEAQMKEHNARVSAREDRKNFWLLLAHGAAVIALYVTAVVIFIF